MRAVILRLVLERHSRILCAAGPSATRHRPEENIRRSELFAAISVVTLCGGPVVWALAGCLAEVLG